MVVQRGGRGSMIGGMLRAGGISASKRCRSCVCLEGVSETEKGERREERSNGGKEGK
jgi:hypothetical protein